MKVKSESEVAQLCSTLRDPIYCSLPGSSVHGIFQARVLDGVLLPSPEEISSLSHCIVFLCFFALITEEGFHISPCDCFEFCTQMGTPFFFVLCL